MQGRLCTPDRMETQHAVPFQIHRATKLWNPHKSIVRDKAGTEQGLTVPRSQAEHIPTPRDQAPGLQQGFLTLLQPAKAPGWSLGCISTALPHGLLQTSGQIPGHLQFPPRQIILPTCRGRSPSRPPCFHPRWVLKTN